MRVDVTIGTTGGWFCDSFNNPKHALSFIKDNADDIIDININVLVGQRFIKYGDIYLFHKAVIPLGKGRNGRV